jgi:hypothetical protein
MSLIGSYTDALAANAVLVEMSKQNAVAPAPVVEDASISVRDGGYPMPPTLFGSESSEGTIYSCWLARGISSPPSVMGWLMRSATSIEPPIPHWVRSLYEASLGEVSDQHIIGMFDALERAIYTDMDGLDTSLAMINTRLLAPEFVVGIPRALFPLRDHLFNWRPFVLRAWNDLSSRRNLDVRELLQGLL